MYDQIDGVAMGSPLGPILANVFISNLECQALKKYSGNLPLVYNRYVDDTFLIFNDRDDSELFLEYMNNLHKNIKFTVEFEENNCLPFLDVLVTRTPDGNIETSVYRKKTFSGLYIKYDSYVPISFKHNLVHGLLNRAFKISSSFEIFKQEVGVIKNILLSNGYSYNFINKHVKHFHNRQNASDNTFTQIPTFGPELRKVFIQLPYCGINSIKLKRQLERVLKIFAPWTKLNIIFKPYYCLSKLSKLKSPVPVSNRSNVVYKIDCLNCDDFYIGMTRRRLHKRLKEHETRQYSAVYKHMSENNHKIDFSNPNVLANDCNKIRLLVKESLNITEHSTHKSLNVNIKSFECTLF